MTHVKVCGVTRVRDARVCVEAGVTTIGLNFVRTSPRFVNEEDARAIADAVRGEIELVGVVADMPAPEMEALARGIGLDWLQLHGHETNATVAALRIPSYRAVRIGNLEDVAEAEAAYGERLLVDARSDAALGGTGETFDWSLVVALARGRRLIVAGGLTPENVARAVAQVKPMGVDVASGVETSPGVKDERKIRAFVAAVRSLER